MGTQAKLPEWAVKIKKVRLLLGESQRQFGKRFGVSQVAVAYWEMGENDPKPSVLLYVYRELGEL
jgi:transcriptional regulator with XRE-family HTH domain